MISLRPVDENNIWTLIKLSVSPEQDNFVATNTQSLLQAYLALAAGRTALPFGIYEGETPVGFCMLGHGATGEAGEPAVAANNDCLWRFMIDRSYQGRGLGRAALRAILAHIEENALEGTEKVWLSYEPENAAARALYLSEGFRENGEMDGEEVVAVRPLRKRAREISLRPYAPGDAKTVVTWAEGEDTLRMWSANLFPGYPMTPQALNGFYEANREAGGFVPLTALADGEIAGHLFLRENDSEGVTRMGLVIVDPGRRGTGLGSAMLRLAIRRAFASPGCKRVTLGVFEGNPAARRCYEAVGFRATGATKTYEIDGTEWRSTEMALEN